MKYFTDVYEEIPISPPKRDIDFSIDLMTGATLVSKIPYKMCTHELKEIVM